MKTKLSALLLASSALCSTHLFAQTNSYTYGERPNFNYAGIGYTWDDLEEFDCEQDGLYVEGSIMVNEQMFLQGQYSDVDGNNGCGSQLGRVGAGIRADFGANSALYGIFSLVHLDYGQDADPGFGLNVGIRSIVAPGVELRGYLAHDDVDEYDQTYLGAGVNYWLSREFSLTGEATVSDDTQGISAGIRLNF